MNATLPSIDCEVQIVDSPLTPASITFQLNGSCYTQLARRRCQHIHCPRDTANTHVIPVPHSEDSGTSFASADEAQSAAHEPDSAIGRLYRKKDCLSLVRYSRNVCGCIQMIKCCIDHQEDRELAIIVDGRRDGRRDER